MSNNKKVNKKLYGRAELKKYFKNGQVPSETHYEYLIDSMINQQEDGFSKDDENGFIVSPVENKKLMTFFRNVDRGEPFFFIKRDEQESASLRFQSGAGNPDDAFLDSSFFFHQDGRLGLGKRSDLHYKLEVNGFIGSAGRTGTYKTGTVKANGEWHPIVQNLDNCQAFEVVARTGKNKSGKFALMHAIALSTFGRSHSRIRKTNAWYGFFWNKLNLRWKSYGTHHFELQLRTNRNYGSDVWIYYNVTKLWDDELFLPKDKDHYYQKKQPVSPAAKK